MLPALPLSPASVPSTFLCPCPRATLALPSPQAQRHIGDLYEDLRDGHNLISLLEVLSGDSLVCVPALSCGLAVSPSMPLPVAPPWGLS